MTIEVTAQELSEFLRKLSRRNVTMLGDGCEVTAGEVSLEHIAEKHSVLTGGVDRSGR